MCFSAQDAHSGVLSHALKTQAQRSRQLGWEWDGLCSPHLDLLLKPEALDTGILSIDSTDQTPGFHLCTLGAQQAPPGEVDWQPEPSHPLEDGKQGEDPYCLDGLGRYFQGNPLTWSDQKGLTHEHPKVSRGEPRGSKTLSEFTWARPRAGALPPVPAHWARSPRPEAGVRPGVSQAGETQGQLPGPAPRPSPQDGNEAHLPRSTRGSQSLQTGNPFPAGSPSTLPCSERGSWPRECPSEAPLRACKQGCCSLKSLLPRAPAEVRCRGASARGSTFSCSAGGQLLLTHGESKTFQKRGAPLEDTERAPALAPIL